MEVIEVANAIQVLNPRRFRLAQAFPATAAVQAPKNPLVIVEVRAWPLKEPVSGNRYTVVRLQSASGLTGFGECRELQAGDLPTANERLRGEPAAAFEVLGRLLRDRPGHPFTGTRSMARVFHDDGSVAEW